MKKPKAQSPKLKAKSEQPQDQQQIAKSQQQIAVMLELLRSAVLDRDPVIDSNVNVDWDDLMDRASKQGILAWVYDGICKLPKEQQPPRQQRINWALSAQEIKERYEKQSAVLDEIVETCRNNLMKVLVLKGVSLSELYPNPSCRPSGDLDVYFYGEYERGNELFGGRDIKISPKHSEFSYHNVNIENHITFLDLDWKTRVDVERFLSSRLDKSICTKKGYFTFEPQSQFLFVLSHSMMHLEGYFPSLSIRSMIDLPMLLAKYPQELSPECCFALVDRFKISYCFELFVLFGEWSLGLDLSNYKRGVISNRDIDIARQLFFQLRFYSFKIKDVTFNGFLKNIKECISLHRWKSKFVYTKRRETKGFIETIVHVTIKYLLRVPLDQPLAVSLKRKNNQCKIG